MAGNRSKHRLSPARRSATPIGLLIVGLISAACGSEPAATAASDETHNLATKALFTSKNAAQQQVLPASFGSINLTGDWADWRGKPTGIQYDSDTDSLSIPAPVGASQLVLGVKRFSQQLQAGRSYSIDTAGSTPGSAVIIYLRNSNGSQIDSMRVEGGQRKAFIATAGIVAFDLQAQGVWQANSASTVRARFSVTSAEPPAPVPAPAPAPTPTPTPAPAPAPAPIYSDFRPAGYDQLFLADEFNGSNLDRSLWCTRLPYGGGPALQVPDAECTKFAGQGTLDYANEEEQQRFRDFSAGTGEALHQVYGGSLKLRSTRTGRNSYLRFESGAIRSKKVFKPSGGRSFYITSRVRLPNILGIWPALFLNPSLEPTGTSTWPPEIDIFEAPINGTGGENQHTMIQHGRIRGAQTASGNSEWVYAAPGFNTDWGFYTAPDNLRDRWIEIGAEWTETGVCYFIDGLKTGCENYRWVANSGQPANPATLIMYLAVGGPWAGKNGIDDSRFPARMEVDYVRVYQK